MIKNDLEKMEFWAERINHVEQYIQSYTFPVFTSKNGKMFELHGTCVSLLIGDKKFLCTAKHLIISVKNASANCYIGANGVFKGVNFSQAISLPDNEIDYDICLIRFVQDINYLDISDFYLNSDFEKSSWQFLQGFPLSTNKYHSSHDNKNLRISSGYINTAVKVDQSLPPSANKQSSDTHLFFSYQEAVFKGMDSNKVEDRRKQNMLSLRGCSGCGLWNISGNMEVKLAGIFTTFKNGVGSATKVGVILNS